MSNIDWKRVYCPDIDSAEIQPLKIMFFLLKPEYLLKLDLFLSSGSYCGGVFEQLVRYTGSGTRNVIYILTFILLWLLLTILIFPPL